MFYYQLLWIFICLQACMGAKFLKEQPKWLKQCEKGAKNFPKCSTESIQNLFDNINNGLPEVGILPTDPLKGLEINVHQADGPININLTLSNSIVTGLANIKVLYNNIEFDKNRFVIRMHIPKLRTDADYKSRGRILIVPLNGDGKCFIEPVKLDVDIILDYNLIKKKNFHFFNVTGINIDYKIGGFSCYYDNLFEGSRELSEGTNEFLNNNWKEAAEAFREILKKTNEDIFIDIFYKVLRAIPADFFVKNLS